MPIFGSDGGFQATNRGGIIDEQGNTVISADTSVGSAPLGYGPLTQVRASLPNGLMSLPPAIPGSVIVPNQNDLPGWYVEDFSNGNITIEWVAMTDTESTAIKDAYLAASGRQAGIAATGTYAGNGALKVSFGTAGSDDYVTITTQAPYASAPIYGLSGGIVAAALNDAGTAVGTAIIPNLAVSADITLLDDAGTAVGTAIAGTYFTGTACLTKLGRSEDTWDTASAVSATVKFAATGAMSGSAYVLISSVYATPIETGNIRASLLTTIGDTIYASQPSYPARLAIGTAGQVLTVGTAGVPTWATPGGGGGGGGSVVVDTFTSNGSWVRPAGVNYVTIVGAGGGGGGGGGALNVGTGTTANRTGAAGGGAGAWYIVRDVDVSGTAYGTVSIGVGVGGAGGTATTFTKAAAATTTFSATAATTGADGGSTTFGTLITIPGGGGAVGANAGTGAGNVTTTIYGGTAATSPNGGGGGSSGANNGSNGGTATQFAGLTIFPYSTTTVAGASGATATGTGGTRGTAAIGTPTVGIIGGGGGSGGAAAASSPATGTGGIGAYSGGGAGASLAIYVGTLNATITGTAGAGGTAAANLGGGGGGGGSLAMASSSLANYNAASLTLSTGAGGKGGDGFLAVVYVA